MSKLSSLLFNTDSCRNTCKFDFFFIVAFLHFLMWSAREIQKPLFFALFHNFEDSLMMKFRARFLFISASFTGQFRFAGQNLAWRGQSWAFEDVSSLMANSMAVWWNEYKLTNQGAIDKCCGWNLWVIWKLCKRTFFSEESNYSHDIGHFTQMAYDRATHVGCAFVRYTNSYKTGLFACNYASGNIHGYRIYQCGAPASRCLFGRNPSYPSLCNQNEPIDPNQIY